MFRQQYGNLLFFVVCRMSKYPRVKTAPEVITTLNRDSMPVRFQELIIENDGPLSMVHFSVTIAHKRGVGCLAHNLRCKSYKGIGKLSGPE